MATQPGGGTVAGSSKATPQKSFFWSCFSCRILTGSGLAGAGLWVHLGVRRSLPHSSPGNLYNIIRLVLAVGLYSAAIVIIVDPVEPK
ncbi:distal membrane-arm assembly complex protein 1 [Notechis scutatus]|uniref:Distal membrane-arm assembly complex protein 1 n=1 Tax=Notechis scutatus TaxID=8663 RepID=A0A6J1W142_9SAUR|nr:distal membrane-arm assembly complex protein 1 [Notechis scutatus]